MENSVGERMGKMRRDTANGGGLSTPLLLILADIKEQEKYKHSNIKGTQTRENALFNVLYLYMKCRGVLHKSFKAKFFNQKNSRVFGHTPKYLDCPLCPGEVWSAIKYGRREGLIFNIGKEGNKRWVFTDKIKEMGT